MPVYAIAMLRFTDISRYRKYQARFMDVFSQFEGKLLSADENPKVIEGEQTLNKVVLMQFPNKQAFSAWAQSSQYLEIAQDRMAGAESVVLLVQGLTVPKP